MTPHDETNFLTPHYIMRESSMQDLRVPPELNYDFSEEGKLHAAIESSVSPDCVDAGCYGWRFGRYGRYNQHEQGSNFTPCADAQVETVPMPSIWRKRSAQIGPGHPIPEAVTRSPRQRRTLTVAPPDSGGPARDLCHLLRISAFQGTGSSPHGRLGLASCGCGTA